MEHVKIYQGNQIGGCVTVISGMYNGEVHRIMIDYGSSLPGSDNEKDYDYPWKKKPVDAVFFTHYHGDHSGRIMEIPSNVPLYMGPVARQAMINIQEALGNNTHMPKEEAELHLKEASVLKDDRRVRTFEWKNRRYQPIEIPGFRIEPYSVDHSAYDAYMFLIEANDPARPSGKYITVHTGDFRGHGRRGHRMLDVIEVYINKHGKRKVDALVIEGTMMSRPNEQVLTEPQMQIEAYKYLSEHKYAFLVCSSTNVDSLASFYHAAQAAAIPYSRYMFVYNDYFIKQLKLYTKTAGRFSDVYKFSKIARLGSTEKLHHEKWDKPKSQKEFMEDYGFLAVIKPEIYHEHFIDEFMEAYKENRIDQKPVIIYSMWDGYLQQKNSKGEDNKAFNKKWHEFFERQEEKGVEIKHLHTSGHATPDMLAKVINAINPQDRIYPMHTEKAKEFKGLKIREELKERIVLDNKCVLSSELRQENITFAAKDDCRAINRDGLLWTALTKGELVPLVDLVRNNHDLELCFRANSAPEYVTVYYNNNEFLSYKIIDGKSEPSYNDDHSRYFKDRISRKNELDAELKNPGNFEGFYKLRKEVMDSYFDEYLTKDYIKDPKGAKPTRKKDCKYEKQEQQKLMSANTNRENGYYIYDMEYAQAFENAEVKKIYEEISGTEKHNKPDSLAIRYENGKPVAIVFVELKTTSQAMKGKCSAVDHIAGMRHFVEWDKRNNKGQFIHNRIIEAQEIMKEYQELDLHNCGEKPVEDEDFCHLDVELLLVITGNERPNMPYAETAKAYYYNNQELINESARDNKCGIILLNRDEFELRYDDILRL